MTGEVFSSGAWQKSWNDRAMRYVTEIKWLADGE